MSMQAYEPNTQSTGADTGMPPVSEMMQHAAEILQGALVAEQDPQISQELAAIVKAIYAITAREQKEKDGMLGNPALARALRRGS